MRILTLVLAGVLAICALPVGTMLLVAPDGHLVGASTDWLLPGLPFSTYLLPGLFLAGPIGAGALLVLVLTWRRSRAASLATAMLGVVVMVWIALQLAMVRLSSPLHAITFGLGLTLALAGARPWVRWVAANALGELAGLGLVAIAATLAAPHVPPSLFMPGMILLGGLEGLIVGAAQAGVLRRVFPRLRSRAWIGGTIAGALVAWLLGMLPSLFMGDGPAEPIDDRVQLALAAALGLVAGPILAAFQLGELARHVRGAGWWLPANALAWAAGMPILFVAAGAGVHGLRAAAFLAAAGAIVGAIHGLALQILRPTGAIPAAGA